MPTGNQMSQTAEKLHKSKNSRTRRGETENTVRTQPSAAKLVWPGFPVAPCEIVLGKQLGRF